MKRLASCIVALSSFLLAQAQWQLRAPNKSIEVSVQSGTQLTYAVRFKGQQVVAPSPVNFVLNNNDSLLGGARVKKVIRHSVNATIISPVPEKRKVIPDVYNELRIEFNRPIALVIRAYNDGVAYRFEAQLHDSIIVQNEVATFRFSPDAMVYYPEVEKRTDADIFHTSFEANYSIKPLDSIAQDSIAFTPVLVAQNKIKVVLTESDLEDYPGMFVSRERNDALKGVFAPYPLEEQIVGGDFKQAIVS